MAAPIIVAAVISAASALIGGGISEQSNTEARNEARENSRILQLMQRREREYQRNVQQSQMAFQQKQFDFQKGIAERQDARATQAQQFNMGQTQMNNVLNMVNGNKDMRQMFSRVGRF